MLQWKELNCLLLFRISGQDRITLGETLYEIAPALTDLMKVWQLNPWAKPKTDLQRHAVSVLACLQGVSCHVRGTMGYKQMH